MAIEECQTSVYSFVDSPIPIPFLGGEERASLHWKQVGAGMLLLIMYMVICNTISNMITHSLKISAIFLLTLFLGGGEVLRLIPTLLM